jgi:hypothetical protein
MRIVTRVSAVLATLFSLATAAQAQSASIQALANVYQPISVTGNRALDFGTVFPGVAKVIAVTDVTSGLFQLGGQASGNVNLTFALPTNLVNGTNNLPIGTWTGCTSPTNTTGGCTTFTPSGTATPGAFSAAGALWVFVAGTVTPGAAQASGNYTGTVTLTAAYF